LHYSSMSHMCHVCLCALHYSSMCHLCLWHCIITLCVTCVYGTAVFQFVPHVPMALHYYSMYHVCLWHCIIPICPTYAYGTPLFQYVPHVPMALHYFSMSYMCLWHSTSLNAHLLDYTLTKLKLHHKANVFVLGSFYLQKTG